MRRKRVKMAPDPSDDAYVFRFARAVREPRCPDAPVRRIPTSRYRRRVRRSLQVLDPTAQNLATAAPSLKADPQAAVRLAQKFKAATAAVDDACRAKAAEDEYNALAAAEAALNAFIELAEAEKYDVRPRDDINAWEASKWLEYPGFLFKAR